MVTLIFSFVLTGHSVDVANGYRVVGEGGSMFLQQGFLRTRFYGCATNYVYNICGIDPVHFTHIQRHLLNIAINIDTQIEVRD